MLNRDQVLDALRNTSGLPLKSRGRTIYETGNGVLLRPSGHYQIDYASFPGGTAEEVLRDVIDQLEREGFIQRAFPNKPEINAWILAV
jgi:hypothetical protein